MVPETGPCRVGTIAHRGDSVVSPSRRVGGGRSNVSGRYPSRKMGVTIQFESHRVELAGIYEMEHDDTVLEYFDQPPPIKLDYESTWEDEWAFCIRPISSSFAARSGLGRMEDRGRNLHRLKRTIRTATQREDGQWFCPPGAAYAERHGLYYRVRSSAEIDWVFQRNIQFLEDYLRGSNHLASSREIVIATCRQAWNDVGRVVAND